MSVPPEDPSEELRRQRLVRELSQKVGKFLLDAARAHPPPWPEPSQEEAPPPRPPRQGRRRKGADDGR